MSDQPETTPTIDPEPVDLGYLGDGRPAVSDLRGILGDKYDDTIEKVREAIGGEVDYLGCGCCTGYNYDESVARTGEDERQRMAAHDALAAVLPDLLAEANARAEDAEAKARRFANLLGNNAKALNDVLPREVLRKKAEAWDEGYDAGFDDARNVQASWPARTPSPYRCGTEEADR